MQEQVPALGDVVVVVAVVCRHPQILKLELVLELVLVLVLE